MAWRVRTAGNAPTGAWKGVDDRPPHRFPEIDCVRRKLTTNAAKAAEARAARLGVGADRVLIAAGILREDDYLNRFASSLGVVFDSLDGTARNSCPLTDARLISAAANGLLPLEIDGHLSLVVAPRGIASRRIIAMIEGDPTLAAKLRLTSAERLNRFVLRHAGKALSAHAANDLAISWPPLAAAPPLWHSHRVPLALTASLILIAAIVAPTLAAHVLELTLAATFVGWFGLRLCSIAIRTRKPVPVCVWPDGELPVYTVMAALYKEAASVDGLLRAIENLDYPPEKLDVIIAVEADDRATRDALTTRKTKAPITIVPVAAAGPRTKPKALNFALPFARGTFVVIYDAEDRPQPDQLKQALQAFSDGGKRLACVQAHLCIDNTADSWLAGFFTAEYAGQFDVFLPGLAAWNLPLPLGGSSNHFRTATLREVHAWDPYNVTEDADLGMRLARFGYRSTMIGATTYEEAPALFAPWLRQRTRWFKGWMQTWLVHMRQPSKLLRDLGLPGFVTFQLIVGGNALAALVHPIFTAALIYLVAAEPSLDSDAKPATILIWLYCISAVAGYLASALLGWLGLKRRGLGATAWVLLLTPLHWLALSLAAWRALYQLIVAPYAWEKTEHGLAKTSRLASRLTRSLIELEHYFRTQKAAGNLPVIQAKPKNISANRRQLPRAAA